MKAQDSLQPLVEQMQRLIRAGKPAAEPAAAELVSSPELRDWLVAASALVEETEAQSWEADVRGLLAGLKRPKKARGRSSTEGFQIEESRPTSRCHVGDGLPLFASPLRISRRDPSLEAYFQRIKGALAGGEFGFVVGALEGASWQAFSRFRRIQRPMIDFQGPRIARFTCFIGDYRRTPFGVHFDPEHLHAFQYVVFGTKLLKAWDPASLARRYGEQLGTILRDTLTAHERLPRTPELIAEPGFLLYWPGSYVHCLEAKGPSAGLGIIFETKAPSMLGQLLAKELTSVGEGPSRATTLSPLVSRLRSKGMALAMAEAELHARSRLGASGFPRQRASPPILDTHVLRPTDPADRPIVTRMHGGRVLIAVNGHGATWDDPRAARDVLRFIAHVNRGQLLPVGDTLKRFASDRFTVADVRGLMAFFVSAGALETPGVLSPPQAPTVSRIATRGDPRTFVQPALSR